MLLASIIQSISFFIGFLTAKYSATNSSKPPVEKINLNDLLN